jgi:hypothetical protein
VLSVPTDLKTTGLRVLAWTGHFYGSDFLAARRIANPYGPDIELEFTTDRDRIDAVDAVWFHAPSIRDLPKAKRCPWVLMSMESDVNYPVLKHPAVVHRFDVLMTYRLDSDVPCIYPNWHQYGSFLDPPPQRRGPAQGALAVYVASNPVAHRDAYVAELMQHLRVDSLGACLTNARIDGFAAGGWQQGAWASLLTVLPRYKFYLAFENSITTDYVTERVFHALVCGVVPVYRGAGNIRDFMPADDAVIGAADFASPRDLAAYLRHLDRNDDAYARHLRWKQDGYLEPFKALVDLGSIDPQQRMAVKLAHGCDRACRCGGRLREPGILP